MYSHDAARSSQALPYIHQRVRERTTTTAATRDDERRHVGESVFGPAESLAFRFSCSRNIVVKSLLLTRLELTAPTH
jgi:hypothetical protein